jgi:hypothetical protein
MSAKTFWKDIFSYYFGIASGHVIKAYCVRKEIDTQGYVEAGAVFKVNVYASIVFIKTRRDEGDYLSLDCTIMSPPS